MIGTEAIVPLVIYLSHESCTENGGLFELAGGLITKLRWQRTEGNFFPEKFTAEDVKRKWEKIISFEGKNDYPTRNKDIAARLINLKENAQSPKL